jgi:DNA adenine methylase
VKFRSLSPLRYPGGKARLSAYLARLIGAQSPRPRDYAEPFAGGAGAALRLLETEEVHAIHLNDLSPAIAAFWRSVFGRTDEFAERIRKQEVTIDAWRAAREVYFAPDEVTDFELGYATFLLNRFNRSGILEAGPIGGLEQKGTWKIGARFNPLELSGRVAYVGDYRNRVHLSQLDAREFVANLEQTAPDTLLYVDPPYLVQGERLYLDSLSYHDHKELAAQLMSSTMPWFLTYDADERITEDLYQGLRCIEFGISHTAHTQHLGAEYAVFSANLTVPGIDVIPRQTSHWVAS